MIADYLVAEQRRADAARLFHRAHRLVAKLVKRGVNQKRAETLAGVPLAEARMRRAGEAAGAARASIIRDLVDLGDERLTAVLE